VHHALLIVVLMQSEFYEASTIFMHRKPIPHQIELSSVNLLIPLPSNVANDVTNNYIIKVIKAFKTIPVYYYFQI